MSVVFKGVATFLHLNLAFLFHKIVIANFLMTTTKNVWFSIYITISTFTSVHPYGGGVSVPLLSFKFLLLYHKVSLIKFAWYVLRVKNMHSWSPPDLWGSWHEEEPSYIHYDIRREEAKQRLLKLASVFHHLPSVSPKQLCALAPLGCTRKAGTS